MSVEAVTRIDQAISHDWDARLQSHESRVAGYDAVRIDAERQVAVWTRLGMPNIEAPTELVGVFFPELNLFRWWWSGKEHAIHLTPSRLDESFAHAQRNDVRALLQRQHQLDGDDDAAVLCRVAAYFAHATMMLRQEIGDRINYFAVFAANTRAPMVAEREVVRTLPPPPIAPTTTPALHPLMPAVREPARALVLPVVHVANTMVQRAFAGRARSALLIVNVDTSRDKARFYVTLVAAADNGDLAAIDTTRVLLDASGTLLAEDARSGNGRWRKLVVRIECEGEGAAIRHCEVTA